MRLEHRAQHGGERVSLWKIREDCSNNPTVKAIIEIDGMDQHKTELPRFEERPKALDRCEVVKNHIVGVLINGREFFVVTHRDHWKRTANVTLSILCQALKRLPTPLPRVLYLQLDNCISENKNITVFFFAALLVHLGIFDMVCVHFSRTILSAAFYNIIRTYFLFIYLIVVFYNIIRTCKLKLLCDCFVRWK